MIRKILIANRGEIACRVIKTARKLGIATVAVYSSADANAMHVQMADEAILLGPAPSKESYLRADKILQAAIDTGADAVHPGYGFLSENADFSRQCAANGIVFIGPGPEAIEAMGSKSAAKVIMEKAGVPLVPGYHGEDQSSVHLKKVADAMGYPVLLKAAAGGGGKGMRQVWHADEFEQALNSAKREALASFGDDIMLVEKYLTQPRHVEIQVFCDQLGNGVYLFERDCSVQRRHQKVIEEAPAPGLSDALRRTMGEAALQAAQAIHYVGAGTVEFLLDHDGSFYFMEMNTRLQVEHPVTEMITGQDLVEWQIRVAEGLPLPKQQHELHIQGHAMEARIYAEDPDNGFLPSTGKLELLQTPHEDAHVRVDTGVRQGDEVSVYYDPMIAKLIVWDTDREKARLRLMRALRDYAVVGPTTNIEFLYNLAAHAAFAQAELLTTFIDKHQGDLFPVKQAPSEDMLAVMALTILLQRQQRYPANESDPHSPWSSPSGWRANLDHRAVLVVGLGEHQYSLSYQYRLDATTATWELFVDNHCFTLSGHLQGNQLHACIDGHRRRFTLATQANGYTLFGEQGAWHFSEVTPDLGELDELSGDNSCRAPMNGTLVTLLVDTDVVVEKGTPLLVMEAMKMEHTILAPARGKVTNFCYAPGELVEGGAALVEFSHVTE